MLHLLLPLLGALRSAFRNRGDLVIENLALRQQLAAFVSSGRRPRVAAVPVSPYKNRPMGSSEKKRNAKRRAGLRRAITPAIPMPPL